MKQCISWIKRIFICLWRTLKEYVCKSKYHRENIIGGDTKSDYTHIVIKTKGVPHHEEVENGKEEK